MSSTYLDGLRRAQAVIPRTSTAERVADLLRQQILESALMPGDRLAEEAIADALQVSRNTLREAFRLLTHERLIVHELNRGMFVRRLKLADVADLYRMRRLVECGVLRESEGQELELAAVGAAVQEGHDAAAAGLWPEVGTANMHFHTALVALAGSPRLDEVMAGLFAEMRLVFHIMANPREFHEPYLDSNGDIFDLLTAGRAADAAQTLGVYLHDAQAQLASAYRNEAAG